MENNVKQVKTRSKTRRSRIKYYCEDIVKVSIGGIPVKAKKIGNSIYLHIPAEIAKIYNICDNNIVKIAILGVEEIIEEDKA